MKIEVFQNNIEQAHKKLKNIFKREFFNFRMKHKNSNTKLSIYKKKFRTRK